MVNKLSLSLLFLVWSGALWAQETLPVPVAIQNAYDKSTRSLSGKPGSKYWQNTADYDLKVNFDPLTRLVKGTADIVYVNNSPDSLKQIWFKLYPNLYKKGVERKAKLAEADLGEGVQISSMRIGGIALSKTDMIEQGTNMHVNVAAIAPGKSIKVSVSYSYVLNKGSHMRTGQVDEGSHFIAYFFPRIAVYDDIDGWNKYPYTGEEEFYNDFCNFKAEVVVPKNFVVWATGDLTNASSVLNPVIAERIKKAEQSDSVVNVISEEDLKAGNVTRDKAFNTWKFDAKNVTDFVFATSDHYLWKSSSLVVDLKNSRRTRVDAAFNPSHKDYYEVIDFARKTVKAMSYDFPKWPFPYSHETIFDGLDQMEYPMMVNDNPLENRENAITLTVHEIFHTMFPFYMGVNETKYGWMDEGWATIGEWLISPMIEPSMVDEYGVAQTGATSGSKDDTPVMTLTPDLKGSGSFTDSYPKPGLGYLYVKDYLGDELFTKALHHYIASWNGKHPMPYDFFYSMNQGSGKNLNWFWKRWFFDDGVTDMGIAAVEPIDQGYRIQVINKSVKPMPVDLTLLYEDGSTEKIHQSIGVWEKGNKEVTVEVKTSKKMKKAELGSTYVPDKDRDDNIFVLK